MAFSRKLFPFSPLLPVLHLLSVLRGLFLKRISCKQISLLKWPLEKWRCNVSSAALHYSAWTFESVFLKLRYWCLQTFVEFQGQFHHQPNMLRLVLSVKCNIWILSITVTGKETENRNHSAPSLTSDFFPTACVECEEQMLPLYLSLLMASVTPTDGQINFTDVTPLFFCYHQTFSSTVQYSTVQM